MIRPLRLLVFAFAAALAPLGGQVARGQIQAMPPANSLTSNESDAYADRGRIVGVTPLGAAPVSLAQATGPGLLPSSYPAPMDGELMADETLMPQESLAPAPWTTTGQAAVQGYNGAAPASGEWMGVYDGEPWTWQLLPDGLMYHSYLAGDREPRIGSQWFYMRGYGWLWDTTLGGRVGILRFGTDNPLTPEGWQVDIEGAGMPRLAPEQDRDLVCADFRFGVPITARRGPWAFKTGYYHLSSHMGDEWMLRHPELGRINYVRDNVMLGLSFYPVPEIRLYAEADYAFYTAGGAEPWEFQIGAEYSPAAPSTIFGAPFFAANAHLRQENDYGGNLTAEAGWQWRGATGKLFRIGAYYFNGLSNQYQFYDVFEDQVGMGAWYDF